MDMCKKKFSNKNNIRAANQMSPVILLSMALLISNYSLQHLEIWKIYIIDENKEITKKINT